MHDDDDWRDDRTADDEEPLPTRSRRPLRHGALGSIALLTTAVASGALAGLLAAAFIWLVDESTRYLWVDLPDAVGVDPFGSWWLFAVPIAGGVLVGAGQILLGNYPRPLEEAIATWKRGGHIEPTVAPKTAANSLVAGLAGVSVVFLEGNVPMAIILTLYPVDLTYASVVLVGCIGGALGLALARSLGALPRVDGERAEPDRSSTSPD